jgi:alkylresorcinol/alkylpyrone synthase
MYLHGISTAVPPVSYSQAEVWDIFRQSSAPERLRPGSVELVRKVLTGNNGISRRHFALHDFEFLLNQDGEGLNHAFEREAPKLAGESLDTALAQAGWQASDLDALITCTCTGYLCPGISSFVAEQRGLRRDAFLMDLVGQGCGAAIPSMRTAANFVQTQPDAKVAVIAVEICTAAFYLDDEAGVLISFCIFGDGAATTLWSGKPSKSGWRADRFDTLHFPENRETLRFENRNGMLRNKLDPSIPQNSSKSVKALYERFYPNGNPPDAVISHGGGIKVLDAIASELPGFALPDSRHVLDNHGNMSSPSVLFALARHLDRADPAPHLWVTSFGAGFTVHGMRLELGS